MTVYWNVGYLSLLFKEENPFGTTWYFPVNDARIFSDSQVYIVGLQHGYYSVVTWLLRYLKLTESRLFVEKHEHPSNKKIMISSHHLRSVGEITGDGWSVDSHYKGPMTQFTFHDVMCSFIITGKAPLCNYAQSRVHTRINCSGISNWDYCASLNWIRNITWELPAISLKPSIDENVYQIIISRGNN